MTRPTDEQPALAEWARTLQRRIRQRGINAFILHGPGVRDIHPLGTRRRGTIAEFLAEVMFSDRAVIILYDRGSGIRFTDPQAEQDFRTVLKAYDRVGGTNLAQAQPRDPDRALQLLETYLLYQLKENPRFSAAVIIDFAETVAPAGNPGQLPVEDRNTIVTLRRWSADPLFLQRQVTFCLVSESTAALNEALVADARTFELLVPVPDERERYSFLAGRGATPQTFSRIDARKVSVLTSGLTCLHLESLLAEADSNGAALDPDALTREKKRLIEEASGGLLTFLTSTTGLDAVAGNEGAKALLRETAAALRQGRLDVVPMGFLVCGPVGTGKSFMVRCFAAEIGIPVVELLNFRSMWQGQTEANLERILGLLDALGPVAVVIDEADAALGNREMRGADSGVSERVFASLAAFMGDTRRRGKVIWFLMTSRPDLVPVDLKRQGRAEEHIALFPPSTGEERARVFESLRARLQIPLEPGTDAAKLFNDVPSAMSPADIEAVLVRASRRMAIEKQPALAAKLLQELIADFQPPAYPAELEYQRLIAAFECTSRQLLPPDLAALSHDAIAQRLSELRAVLGRHGDVGSR
ncbi:MAG: AAA family ATPase [Gemmatimonadetes bacterium]|nr:MAG: AAA family ATPase [Gemmatimonadota bacterium]